MAKLKWHGWESDEEYHYYSWLTSLQGLGCIRNIDLKETFHLVPAKRIKLANKEVSLLQKTDYTSDFTIVWHEDWKDKLFITENSDIGKQNFKHVLRHKHFAHKDKLTGYYYSVVDTKGDNGKRKQSSDYTFPVKRKMVMQKYNIFVNKIMPLDKKNGLFMNTFTPPTYLKTPTGRDKKINWDVKTATKYVDSLEQTSS